MPAVMAVPAAKTKTKQDQIEGFHFINKFSFYLMKKKLCFLSCQSSYSIYTPPHKEKVGINVIFKWGKNSRNTPDLLPT